MQERRAAGADVSSEKAREKWRSMSWGRSAQSGQVCTPELWCEGPLGPWGWSGWSSLKKCNTKVSIWILRWKCPPHLPLNTFSTEGDGDALKNYLEGMRAINIPEFGRNKILGRRKHHCGESGIFLCFSIKTFVDTQIWKERLTILAEIWIISETIKY